MALLLGYMLRYELKPIMARSGKRLENVLLVSDNSLEKAAAQAVCNFWPLRVVDLPEVHEDRRAATSKRLTARALDDRRVFLKKMIFRTEAKVGVISDIDLVVTNPNKLATTQLEFLDASSITFSTWVRTRVAVLLRRHSKIVFDHPPQSFPKELSAGRRKHGVSFCYAIVKPSPELAGEYEKRMQSTRWSDPKAGFRGCLSDQDLFENFLDGNLTMMSHEFIAFPSWWFHTDVFYRVLPDLKRERRKNETYYQTGRRMAAQLGAVHLSTGFHVVENEGTDKRRATWHASLDEGLRAYNRQRPHDMTQCDWRNTFYDEQDLKRVMDLLTGLADAVLFEHLSQRLRLTKDIQLLLGNHAPETGIGHAASKTSLAERDFTVYAELQRKSPATMSLSTRRVHA